MKKRYLSVFIICLFVFVFFLLYQGTSYFSVISRYFNDGEEFLNTWKESCVAYGRCCEDVNGPISLTKDYLNSFQANLAYLIDHGTMPFGYLVPLLCVFSGINFRKYLDTTFSLQAYRCKNFFHFIFCEMNKESFKCAIPVYLSYLIFFSFILFIIQPTKSIDLTKYFLSDIFGENFYLKEQELYYLTEGTIRFFFVAYVYSFLGTVFSYIFKKKINIIIVPLLLYYGITFVCQFLFLWNINFIYIDPIVIMANGALSGYNSFLLITFPILIYLAGILTIKWKSKKCDIYVK